MIANLLKIYICIGSGDNPQFRALWRDMAGMRGRAFLRPKTVTSDSTVQVEDLLINEGALELAYEGQRWPDLLRVALRRNNASYLTSKVAARLRKEGRSGDAARIEGMSLNELYLPFKWR